MRLMIFFIFGVVVDYMIFVLLIIEYNVISFF